MGEIQPNKCEGRELTKDQLAADGGGGGGGGGGGDGEMVLSDGTVAAKGVHVVAISGSSYGTCKCISAPLCPIDSVMMMKTVVHRQGRRHRSDLRPEPV